MTTQGASGSDGLPRGATVAMRFVLPLLIGIVVASALVFPTLLVHSMPGSPTPDSPFSVGAVAGLVSSGPNEYVYNVSILYIGGGNASTTWTQIYSSYHSTWSEVALQVALVDGSGREVANYNSSNSTFCPCGGYNSTTFPNLGGWEPGTGVPIVGGDTLIVKSSVSLSECSLYLWMASTTPPHWMTGQDLLP